MGLRFIFDRIRWDLKPSSRVHRAKLRELKNIHIGEKAVILCNGPSLLDVDFNLINEVYTFGLNKVNLLFDTTNFRPSFIVSINTHVLEQNAKFYSSTEIPLFLDSVALKHKLPLHNNVCLLHSNSLNYFARDCSMSVSRGHTITYVALQLAYHMGFEKVALVGCDHPFEGAGVPNKEYKAEGIDKSHFDEKYFTNGQSWQYPDLEQSEINYKLAKIVFEQDNRLIVNASTTTHLNVLPKMDLKTFLDLE